MAVAFVPDDFAVPLSLRTDAVLLVPLGPEHNEADFAAWTSSVEHIRATPGFAGRSWPDPEMTLDANLADLVAHAHDFAARRGFTYTVLDPASGELIGCVYIYPAAPAGGGAAVRSWVRASRAHLDAPLHDAVGRWLVDAWPFGLVDYAPRATAARADYRLGRAPAGICQLDATIPGTAAPDPATGADPVTQTMPDPPLIPVEVLLVEDDPGDVLMTREAFADHRVHNSLHVVGDGVEALSFLRGEGEFAGSPRPDLILLDLNLPRKDGREVLAEIKADQSLRRIPVVVLTTSESEEDILRSYDLHANAYITKPVDFESFVTAVRNIDEFFVSLVRLPSR